MEFLIDVNVLLDYFLKREPFSKAAKRVYKASVYGVIELYITANMSTDIQCFLTKGMPGEEGFKEFTKFLQFVKILSVTQEDCHAALKSGIPDYEDALIAMSAKRHGITAIITRNVQDFGKSHFLTYTPEEILEKIKK